jgi:hypothetical protein
MTGFWGAPQGVSKPAQKEKRHGRYQWILLEVQEEGRYQGPSAHHDEER